jgi:hypothetical protein
VRSCSPTGDVTNGGGGGDAAGTGPGQPAAAATAKAVPATAAGRASEAPLFTVRGVHSYEVQLVLEVSNLARVGSHCTVLQAAACGGLHAAHVPQKALF